MLKNIVFSDNQFTEFNGAVALKSTYKFSLLSVSHSGELLCFTSAGRTIFILTQGADEDLNKNKNEFEAISNSIKIVN